MFIDRVTVDIRAGKGGDGCVSFRREKYISRGGPNGGDGGHGGSVMVIAETGVDSLVALVHRKHWRADSGHQGGSNNCTGASADDLIIRVPPGTVIVDAEHDFVVKDLVAEGDSVCAARGGKAGRGNTHFKSSTNRAPREATRGSAGEARRITFELKVIADVGLVGLPNAGKSTLLSRVSRARPEIADYPFTTKIPNLGLVQLDIDRSLVMADIPGLIEGAHAGAGLGHEFLRHVERTRILIHLVEPMPVDASDPIENYHAIRSELQKYQVDLTDRPEIVAVSKCELPGAEEVQQRLSADLGRDVLAFSAVTGQGLDRLLRQVSDAMVQLDGEPPS